MAQAGDQSFQTGKDIDETVSIAVSISEDQKPTPNTLAIDGQTADSKDDHSSASREHNRSTSTSQDGDPNSKSTPAVEKVSKRQQRKRKKREIWESVRLERRKQERLRRQKRKQEALARGEQGPSRKRPKADPNRRSECLISVAIDMSFDDLMSEKDQKRSLTQIQYCYSVNRRAQNPLQFYVTSFDGKSREIFDRTRGCQNWDEKCIRIRKENYSQVFAEKEKIIYLTSESPNVLEKLDRDKIYIIGGLIDHNSHKGLCYRLAQEKGIDHARLPIDEYVVMKTRKVLTINHVFEIMLRYTEMGDWEKALFHVLPKRKEASRKIDID